MIRKISFAVAVLLASGCGSQSANYEEQIDPTNPEQPSGEDTTETGGEGETVSGPGNSGNGASATDGGKKTGDAGAPRDSGAGTKVDSGGGQTEPPPPPGTVKLAQGLRISEVAAFQAIKVSLEKEGTKVQTRNAPIVAKRRTLLRVYVTPETGWSAHSVTGELRLSLNGTAFPVISDTKTISAASSDADLKTTFNFDIPEGSLPAGVQFTVAIRDEQGVASTTSKAQYPVGGALETLGAQAGAERLRIRIVPISYGGRVPDTSAAQVERYRQVMYNLYPAAKVEIDVRKAAYAWSGSLGTRGENFSDLVEAVMKLRSGEVESDDIYYYGAINPTASVNQFCVGGCVAGLTITSSNTSDPDFRVSAGLGFKGSEGTMAHEIGHAHGRNHAPCTELGDISSVDSKFPSTAGYLNGKAGTSAQGGGIGVWGYNLTTKLLVDPKKAKDVMGYCNQTFTEWISDYGFQQLFTRITKVTAQTAGTGGGVGGGGRYRFVRVNASGELSWGETLELATPPSSEPYSVQYTADDGQTIGTVTGHYYPHSDIPGGVMLIPEPAANVRKIVIPGLRDRSVGELFRN